jgi:hypothetical protein
MNTQEPWKDLTAEDVWRIKQSTHPNNTAMRPYMLAGSVSAFLGMLVAAIIRSL